jgi:hypothetical protein
VELGLWHPAQEVDHISHSFLPIVLVFLHHLV